MKQIKENDIIPAVKDFKNMFVVCGFRRSLSTSLSTQL